MNRHFLQGAGAVSIPVGEPSSAGGLAYGPIPPAPCLTDKVPMSPQRRSSSRTLPSSPSHAAEPSERLLQPVSALPPPQRPLQHGPRASASVQDVLARRDGRDGVLEPVRLHQQQLAGQARAEPWSWEVRRSSVALQRETSARHSGGAHDRWTTSLNSGGCSSAEPGQTDVGHADGAPPRQNLQTSQGGCGPAGQVRARHEQLPGGVQQLVEHHPARDARAPVRPATASALHAGSARDRLLLAARREAEARIEAEMHAADNEELRALAQRLQQEVDGERATRHELELRLAVRTGVFCHLTMVKWYTSPRMYCKAGPNVKSGGTSLAHARCTACVSSTKLCLGSESDAL